MSVSLASIGVGRRAAGFPWAGRLATWVFVSSSLACAAPSSKAKVPARDLGTGPTRPGCTGRLSIPAGSVQVDDPTGVVAQMRKPAGEGGLCHAQRHRLEKPVTVHRVFSSRHPDRRLDGAWTVDLPDGTREQLRRDLGVCEAFSALDRVIVCELARGTSVVLGLGQSIACGGEERYPQSATTQVWIVDADTVARAARCHEEPWPR